MERTRRSPAMNTRCVSLDEVIGWVKGGCRDRHAARATLGRRVRRPGSGAGGAARRTAPSGGRRREPGAAGGAAWYRQDQARRDVREVCERPGRDGPVGERLGGRRRAAILAVG